MTVSTRPAQNRSMPLLVAEISIVDADGSKLTQPQLLPDALVGGVQDVAKGTQQTEVPQRRQRADALDKAEGEGAESVLDTRDRTACQRGRKLDFLRDDVSGHNKRHALRVWIISKKKKLNLFFSIHDTKVSLLKSTVRIKTLVLIDMRKTLVFLYIYC
jgi:hypothetical protein